MNIIYRTTFVLILFISVFANASDKSTIDFPEFIALEDGAKLVLNGTGVRKKWFIQVYEAGLYLPDKSTSAEAVLSMSGAKQIRMVFLRKIEKEKLIKSLDEGFSNNHMPEQMALFSEKLSQLKSFFHDVKKNDEVLLRYTDTFGTQIFFNDTLQGSISGFDFNQAMLRVWLGDVPADAGLKQGLLGQ